MHIEILFLLTTGAGTLIYLTYIIKTFIASHNPTRSPTPLHPTQPTEPNNNQPKEDLTQKLTQLENDNHNLTIALKLQPNRRKRIT
jgi:hypothetical protein